MVKKTREVIEEEEDTVTKIACEECDTRFDNRRVRGKQGVTTLVLDAEPIVRRRRQYSTWGNTSWNKNISQFGSSLVMITTPEIADYCNPCFEGIFIEEGGHEEDLIDQELTPSIEVEETVYDTTSKCVEEYLCDMCGSSMGDEYDHTVHTNPRIKLYRDSMSGKSASRTNYDMNETVYISENKVVKALYDDEYHICHTCKLDLFGRSGDGGTLMRFCSRVKNFI